MNINWANVQLDNPLLDDDEIRNLNELAYKNNCGDISGSNIVYKIIINNFKYFIKILITQKYLKY